MCIVIDPFYADAVISAHLTFWISLFDFVVVWHKLKQREEEVQKRLRGEVFL